MHITREAFNGNETPSPWSLIPHLVSNGKGYLHSVDIVTSKNTSKYLNLFNVFDDVTVDDICIYDVYHNSCEMFSQFDVSFWYL